MKFEVLNTETQKLISPRNYFFVIQQNGELWTVNVDGSFTKADEKYKIVNDIGCACSDDEKHGETSVMCCNECGLPTENHWTDVVIEKQIR